MSKRNCKFSNRQEKRSHDDDLDEPLEMGETYTGRIWKYGRYGDPLISRSFDSPVYGSCKITVVIKDYEKRRPRIGAIVEYEVKEFDDLQLLAFAELV